MKNLGHQTPIVRIYNYKTIVKLKFFSPIKFQTLLYILNFAYNKLFIIFLK